MLNAVYQCLFLLTINLIQYEVKCARCNSFNDVQVTARGRNGETTEGTVTGCIERSSFSDRAVAEVHIHEQNIPRLGKDSIRNMPWLNTVVLDECNIQFLDVGSFRNLPRLKNVLLAHGELAIIPVGVFSDDMLPQLEVLKIQNHEIKTIEDRAFANILDLKQIYLNNNQLTKFNRDWFINTTMLELMDFQFNKIRSLPSKAFDKLRKLKKIVFDYNDIETIKPDAFRGHRRLSYLGLRYNRLTHLDNRIFPNEISVKAFYIDANFLNYLSQELRTKLSVNYITLDGNPWSCPCLKDLKSWLERSNGTVEPSTACETGDIPVCSYPSADSNVCDDVVEEEMTNEYLDGLRKMEGLDTYCARLD